VAFQNVHGQKVKKMPHPMMHPHIPWKIQMRI
jgi:hypothetical protein